MKRILSLAIVLVMLFALAAPVIAAGEEREENKEDVNNDDYVGAWIITVNGYKTGHTYEAYQIFEGDLDETGTILSNIKWGTGVDGAGLLELLQKGSDNRFATYDEKGNVSVANVFATVKSAADVAKVLSGYGPGDKMVGIFAEAAEEFLTKTYFPLTAKAEDTTVYHADVDEGYYLIKDKDNSLGAEVENDFYTGMILQVVGHATATVKGNVPTVDKSVNSQQGGTFAKHVDSEIGDYDYFKIEGKLPSNFNDYTVYPYTFVDNMPVGVDFIEIVEANVIHGSGASTAILNNSYTVHYCDNPEHYTHDVGCYDEDGARICESDSGHTHSDACYQVIDSGTSSEKKVRVCKYHAQHDDDCTAHVHTLSADCFEKDPSCELTEHEHDLTTCYTDGTLSCTTPAHAHRQECYTKNCEKKAAHTHLENCKENCGYKLVIEFPDVKTAIPAGTRFGDTIMFKYKVRVNEHVTLGATGNKNEVTLIYANDPTSFGPTGKTPPATSIIFSFGMDVDKVDASSQEPLDGAKFVLYTRIADERDGAQPNHYFIEYLRFNEQGEFTGLTYRTENAYPETADALTIWEAVKKNAEKDPVRKQVLQNCVFEVKNDETDFELKGLDAKVYRLLEVEAPNGYNLPKNAFVITIEPVYDGTVLSQLHYEIDGVDFTDGNVSEGTINATITNSKGDVLPSTGGIGTTIFYAIGGVLAAVAVVLLITKKRMTSEE